MLGEGLLMNRLLYLYFPCTHFRTVHVSHVVGQYPTTSVDPMEEVLTWVTGPEGEIQLSTQVGKDRWPRMEINKYRQNQLQYGSTSTSIGILLPINQTSELRNKQKNAEVATLESVG